MADQRFAAAIGRARRIGQALLNLGLNADRPVAILSDNSVDHALLALGAMHAGVPVAPVSPAYSLMSKDFAKLKYIFDLLKPGLVFAAEPKKVTYEDDVLPIFRDNCLKCHNPDKLKGDLDLSSFSSAIKGGGSGTTKMPTMAMTITASSVAARVSAGGLKSAEAMKR